MTKKIKLKNVPYTIVSTYFGREHSGSQAETWKVSLRAEPRSVNAYIKPRFQIISATFMERCRRGSQLLKVVRSSR
ncbi:hypothetical protein CRN62_12345, partial [Vibrio vulnificus]